MQVDAGRALLELEFSWNQIRVDAGRALLEIEFQCHGIDAALMPFIRYVNDEKSLRGQVKLAVCALRLCQMTGESDCDKGVKSDTLVTFLRLLESPVAFNNIILRHYIYCILQVLAGRAPTLYGVPRDEILRIGHTKTSNALKNIFAALIKQSITTEPSSGQPHVPLDLEGLKETDSENHEPLKAVVVSPGPDRSVTLGAQMITNAPSNGPEQSNSALLLPKDDLITIPKVQLLPEGQEPMEPATFAFWMIISSMLRLP